MRIVPGSPLVWGAQVLTLALPMLVHQFLPARVPCRISRVSPDRAGRAGQLAQPADRAAIVVDAHAPAILAIAKQLQCIGGAGSHTQAAPAAQLHIYNHNALIAGRNDRLAPREIHRVCAPAQTAKEML